MVLSMSCEPLSRSAAGMRVCTTSARRRVIRDTPPRRHGRGGSATRRLRARRAAPGAGRARAATPTTTPGLTARRHRRRRAPRPPSAGRRPTHRAPRRRHTTPGGRRAPSRRAAAAPTRGELHCAARSPGAQQTGRVNSCQAALTSGDPSAMSATDRSKNTLPPADSNRPSARRTFPATARSGSAARQGSGRLDGAREREHVWLDDDHDIVICDLLEAGGRECTEAKVGARVVDPARERGSPARVGARHSTTRAPAGLGDREREPTGSTLSTLAPDGPATP